MDPPSPLLLNIIRGINRFSDFTGRAVSWLVLAIVLMTFAVVVMRYAFNVGSIFVQELVTYFHNYVIMLGAAYTLLKGGHVRVDIFYRPMSARKKAWFDLAGFFVLLLPACGFIFYISWEYVAFSWQIWEGSQEAGGVEARYLFKTSILIMPVLMILQGAAESLKSLLVICGYDLAAIGLDEHAEEHGL